MAPLRLATRGSPQASTQAAAAGAAITAATGRPVELVVVETTGDRRPGAVLHAIGGQGVFTKEVTLAVLDGRADVAVHSAKDLPTAATPGVAIGAFCARRDPADALVGRSLHSLAPGATVATGSVRRRGQLAAVRPDLEFVELRGNIARRLDQVPPGGSIVMAVAALEVLGLTDRVSERLDPIRFVPAAGQGCVAIECRDGDPSTLAELATVDDAPTRHAVTVERAFLGELGTGCSLPIGAHVAGGRLHVFLGASDVLAPRAVPSAFRDVVELKGVLGDDVAAAREAAGRALRGAGGVAAMLTGVDVVVTRPDEGAEELIAALRFLGATVGHVPLIAIEPPRDPPALDATLARLGEFEWLVVTSANGARAVGAAAAQHAGVRLAAVGRRTADVLAELAGRAVDLVPTRARAAGLVDELPADHRRVLVAQADRASGELADGLRARGFEVEEVEAYRTVERRPGPDELDRLAAADVVVLASGSAAGAWAGAAGSVPPAPRVVAIGPTTAAAARRLSITVTAVATSPTTDDVVAAVSRAAGGEPSGSGSSRLAQRSAPRT